MLLECSTSKQKAEPQGAPQLCDALSEDMTQVPTERARDETAILDWIASFSHCHEVSEARRSSEGGPCVEPRTALKVDGMRRNSALGIQSNPTPIKAGMVPIRPAANLRKKISPPAPAVTSACSLSDPVTSCLTLSPLRHKPPVPLLQTALCHQLTFVDLFRMYCIAC